MTIDELLSLSCTPIERLLNLSLGYTETNGNENLRKQIANQYKDVESESVVFLGSPVEGIFLIACSMLDKNDEVIVLGPAYDALRNSFEFVVGSDNVRTWHFKEDGFSVFRGSIPRKEEEPLMKNADGR